MKSMISILCLVSTISGGSAISSSPFQDLDDRDPFSESLNNDETDFESDNQSFQSHMNHHITPPRMYYDEFLANQESSYRKGRENNYYRSFNRYEEDPGNRRSEGTSVYRTYGRGRAHVSRLGDTVVVPNELARRNAYRSHIADREDRDSRSNGRSRCKECPTDQTVVATKGNTFVILPEPCPSNPRMWNQHSGPRPGTKIREGVHIVRGFLGPKKKFCEYQYQVLVHRCEPLRPEEDMTIDCTENELWGSRCTVTCGPDKEALGPTDLECMEDLNWSNPIPKCKGKMDCTTPKVKTNSKIWCQTSNMTYVEGEFIPNGSTCRFNKAGREVSINCKEGTWRISRKSKYQKKNKKAKPVPEKKENPCDPNPCENGGTCLKPVSSKGPPICVCRPQTQGAKCEMRECDYNICHNYGMCFFQNNERTCYCLPEFNGDQCQYHANN